MSGELATTILPDKLKCILTKNYALIHSKKTSASG